MLKLSTLNTFARSANLERIMTITILLIIVVAVGSVIAGVLLLKQSARKLELTNEQKQRIAAREAEQLKKDQEQK